MACGFSERLLLLSLLAFVQPAEAYSYSSEESVLLNPRVQLHRDFPKSTKPASASPTFEGSTQAEGSPGSSENLERTADAPWTGGSRGSYGGQVGRASVERYATSVRKTPQQQHFQSVPFKFVSAQKKRYALGIVSSPAIEMHFGPSESKTEPQRPSHLVRHQHQSRPIFHPDQVQQMGQQVWPQQPDRPQLQHLSHPVFRPQRLVYDITRRKPDLWRFHVPPTETRLGSAVASGFEHEPVSRGQSEAQPRQPSYLAHVQPTDSNSHVAAEAGRPRSFGKVLVYGPGW